MASTLAPHEGARLAPPPGAARVAPTVADVVAHDGSGEEQSRALVFRAGSRVYACAVAAVREVAPLASVTRLPGAPDSVLGITNLRGAIVTVLDAGALLHGSPKLTSPTAMLLVVDVGPRGVGLAVDRVADVRALRPDEGYAELDVRELCARVIAITEEDE